MQVFAQITINTGIIASAYKRPVYYKVK